MHVCKVHVGRTAFLNVEHHRFKGNVYLMAAVTCVTLRLLLVKVLITLILLGNMSAKRRAIFSLSFCTRLLVI